jgi:hypothetical protein
MKNYLLFYMVKNAKGYGRHEFDYCFGNFNECMRKVAELPKEEWRLYHTDRESELEGLTRSLYEFCEDLNDSVLDAWWSVLITKID